MAFLLALPFGGLLYRVRGGLFGDWLRARIWAGWGNTAARGLFCAASAGWAWGCSGDVWTLLLAPLLFLGVVLGWWKAGDIGRDGDRPRLTEAAIMTGRGLLLTLPAGTLLFWLGHGWLFLASGLAMGALYELGHRTPTLVPDAFDRGMPWAEFYFGCWLWLALFLSV